MAGRPPKKGIDYAGWSVDIFDNDTKIDKLLDAHGWDGFGIYFYLCQRAYGGEGYFYKWGYDDCASTSRKMGGGIGSGTVREAVGYCLQIGLFDNGLFDRWGVLTSRGIQRRYWEVVKARDVRTVISDYWLLQDNECKGLIKIPLNTDYPAGNTDYPAGNTNYPAGNTNYPDIKESKVNKSKVKQRDPLRLIEEFISAYPQECNRYLTENEYCKLIMEGKVTEEDLVECAKNYAEYCRILKVKKQFVKKADNFLKDFTFIEYLPEKYQNPEPKEKSGFNGFKQNNYDFEQLEKELMDN